MGLARPIRDSRRVRVVLASSGFCPLLPPSATSSKNLKLTLAQGCDRHRLCASRLLFRGAWLWRRSFASFAGGRLLAAGLAGATC